ncbi:methyltransferase domain-containing protein [Allokutzneria sp. A3M-2-11 16]|uniref:methyltransferase domain-containing protein n=1 Tax=Allokutzneria sp. A3M-2-11 16 TaxID=2962043 RepID=UPI0020B66AE7|nr:methyltransferase domain-containing protein [Allokutzneria sp. A3M-2-11 16]MCP3801903.1 methyltransferase domain-containing protein [Allokutzneria sp. A3M-2-11 16]
MVPEVVEFRTGEQLAVWQDFRLSTMPDIISSMHLCHAVFALVESGMLGNLRDGRRLPEDGLLAGTVERIGTDFLRYLVMREVLELRDTGYFLTRKGELLTSDVSLARLGVYLEAYGSVTSRMSDLLTGKATYGDDVRRDGGPLGKHSATLFSIFHTPVLVEAMRGRGVRRLLDIGCGGGSLLVNACLRDPELTGIGLDVDADAIEEAKRLAEREGIADRLEFVVGDAFAPQEWPEVCLDADGLCIVSALHELFRDGEQAVIDMLNAYAAVLPEQKILLVGEPELRYDARDNDDDFFLIHVLTDQGLPRDRAAWLEVFGKTDLECRRIYRRPDAGPRVCFYDLAPRRR